MRPNRITGNIFVANLPSGFTDARLAQLFDPYGLVLIAYLARDPETGALRNHGLVDLAPSPAATRAIAALDGYEIEGQRIAVRIADPSLALRPLPRPAAARRPRFAAVTTLDEGGHSAKRIPIVERRPLPRRWSAR